VIDPQELARAFEAIYRRPPRLYRAPGRVNLIGEHTDYNDGFVLPMAIDRSTWVAGARREDRRIVVRSCEYGETATIELPEKARAEAPRAVEADRCHWTAYVRGVASVLDGELRAAGRTLVGADLLIGSDVPIGSGLSSSAALEIACCLALADLSGAALEPTSLARVGQRAEHEFAGTRCGIMDQMIACHARRDHALWLDTRTLECRWLPLPADVRVVICNTMVAHRLASAEYNARRTECEVGVELLRRRHPGVRALRDAALGWLQDLKDDLREDLREDTIFRRCRHVITENARVGEAARALAAGDLPAFGRLMNDSHESLRSDYEVSCAELDTMVSIAQPLDGVYGARLTGGGFGGCVVALVDAAAASFVEQRVLECYEAATGLRPEIWTSSAGAGAGAGERSGVECDRGAGRAAL
jgi:galactokinase